MLCNEQSSRVEASVLRIQLMTANPNGPWSNTPQRRSSVPGSGPKGSPPKGPRGPVWLWLLLAGLAVGGLVLWLMTRFPDAVDTEMEEMALIRRLLFVALIGAGVVMHIRSKPGLALRHAAVWLAIGGTVLLAYSFRHEAAAIGDRLMANLIPGRGMHEEASVTLFAGRGGHFVAEAVVDGVPVTFLVDTGASDVVLSPRDAARVGFDPSKLRFDKAYNTANGVVMGAPVRLGRVAIGPVELDDVRASVNGAAMKSSLLGMSFLSRIGGYEVVGDRLILRR